MKPIKYTPDAAEKLRKIKKNITVQYGREISDKILKRIMSNIRNLSENENIGLSVEKMYDLQTDYRYLYVAGNYVFYRAEEDQIKIINIYHEREDFMWQLLGIKITSEETLDYWKE